MLLPIANTDSVSKPSTRKYAYWNVHRQECMCHVMCYPRCYGDVTEGIFFKPFRDEGGWISVAIGNARVAHVAGWRMKSVSSEHPCTGDYLGYAVSR